MVKGMVLEKSFLKIILFMKGSLDLIKNMEKAN
jgi:hypothetical protein